MRRIRWKKWVIPAALAGTLIHGEMTHGVHSLSRLLKWRNSKSAAISTLNLAHIPHNLIQLNELSPQRKKVLIEKWERIAREKLPAYIERKAKPMTRSDQQAVCMYITSLTHLPVPAVRAFMIKESSGDPTAIGGKLEIGLFQFKPQTIAEIERLGYTIENPLDAYQNAHGFAILVQNHVRCLRDPTIPISKNGKTNYQKVRGRYEWKGKITPFDQLPFEIQLKLLARIHNAGPGGMFNGMYDFGTHSFSVDKMIDGNKGVYANQVWENYIRFNNE